MQAGILGPQQLQNYETSRQESKIKIKCNVLNQKAWGWGGETITGKFKLLTLTIRL